MGDGRWGAWIGALLAVGLAGQARAEGEPAALSWVRGPAAQDCASARVLADAVEAQMGRTLFVAPAQATIWVEASIERSEAPLGYVVRFGLVERGDRVSATRTLNLPPVACRELDPLLAFVLATMLDPDAPLLPPRLPPVLSDATRGALADLFGHEPTVPPIELAAPGETPVERASESPAAPGTSEPAAAPTDSNSDPDTAAHPQPTLVLFAGGGVGAGVVPGIVPTGTVEVRWRFADAWVLRGGGTLWPERGTSPVAAADVGFSALVGQLSVCPALSERTLAVRLCAGGLVGSLTTSVRGAELPRDPTRPYAAASLSADLAWSPGASFWLRAGAVGFAPFVRDRFLLTDVDGVHAVYRPAPFGGGLDVGLGYAFF